jgi:NAD(P)-dependent dehydrogenase (short-subunit alcohol dehydrogenase family)
MELARRSAFVARAGGLGRTTVRRFAEPGVCVVVVDVDAERAGTSQPS